ncbi:MAG: DUF362 domain-containing protein [Oscillospiraceae bacterium]
MQDFYSPTQPVHVRRATYGNRPQIEQAAASLLSLLPAVQALTPESRVLVKPNLLAKHSPETAVTTHPDVLRAVILALHRRGVRHITVADSSGGIYTPSAMAAIYRACGIQQVCEETGAALYTACEFAPAPGKGTLVKEFNFIKPVFECDLIVNLPKLKCHVMTVLSGAVKNLFGLVPGLQKAEFHMQFPQKQHFGQMLVDLNLTLPPTVHLVDGILAMEGDGPSGGTPRQTDLLFASQNPFTLDLCLCRYTGLAPMQVPTLAAAYQNGLCPERFEEELLHSETPEERQSFASFTPPKSYSGPLNFSQQLPKILRPLVRLAEQWVSPRPVIRRAACIGCGKCAEICPQKVITLHSRKAHIAYKNCIHCFCCHEMCPVKAIGVRRNPLVNHS